jgi:AcrR family transcriptional regulator
VLTQNAPVRPDDKRARLLEATRRVMAERGVAGCTTQEIAKAAGVAQGTIYNQFRDKADLYLSVASDLIPEFLRRPPEEPGRKAPRAVLTKVANETITAMSELVPLLCGIVGEPELRAGAHDRWKEKRSSGKSFAGLTEYFRAEQAAGTIGDRVEAAVLARMFVGTVFHHAFMRLLVGESNLELSGKRFVASLVDAVLAAAGPPGAERPSC